MRLLVGRKVSPLISALALLVSAPGCSSTDTPSPGPDAPLGGSGGGGASTGAGGSGGGAVGGAGASGSPQAAGAGAGGGGSPGTAGAAGSAGSAGIAGSAGGPSGGGGNGGSGGAGGTAGTAPGGAAGAGGGVTDPGTEGDGKFTIQSPFKAGPAQTVGAGVPRGTRVDFTVNSAGSKFYPTASGNSFTRKGSVYLPAGYVSGTEVPFMVVHDGSGYYTNVANALDNLIRDKKVPPMAGIFLDPGPGSGQRSMEYDTVSDKFTQFFEAEVLPVAVAAVKSSRQLDLKLTTNPEGRGTLGGSSGGAVAFTMGWFHPELYRRIVSYSGSFVKLAASSMYPNGAADYHQTLIPGAEKKPLRVFLAVGTNDLDNQFGGWLDANEAMFAELTEKGYHVRYVRATGGVHVDGGVFGQTLGDTLTWVWRGYPIP
jgi:iron(III)-enterobactin esterase